MRSIGDFYFGFGLFVSIALLAEAVAFWQLSVLARSEAARLRPIFATFAVCYLGYAAIAFLYFFAAPGLFEVLIAACLAGAFVFASNPSRMES
jgi:hypothetical protein